MKLAPRTFRVGWDVHAWAGIIAALLLYVMFFAGALTLFRDEIDAWQESSVSAPRPALGETFARVVREHSLEGQRRVALRLHDTAIDVEWTDPAGEHAVRVDPAPRPPRSRIGHFLFELHFLGIAPKGSYFAGVLAVALGLAAVTGLVIQWKDLLAQLFRVRSREPRRVWTSDLHKVLSVWGAPFQLFFAWSGAVLCLAFVTVWPALVSTVFRGDMRAARVAFGDLPQPPKPSGEPAPLPELDRLVREAETRLPGLRPRWIGVQSVGDSTSSVRIFGDVDGVVFGSGQILLAACDGAVLGVSDPRNSPPAARFRRWFFGLHFARFSSPWRALYALFAFATCAVIATGNIVWIERRDPGRERRSTRWLEAATIAVCAGLPFAVGALFAANALLPTMRARVLIELAVFWSAWAAAAMLTTLLPARRATLAITIAGAALFLATAALTAARVPLVTFGLVAIGLTLGAIAATLGRPLVAPPAEDRDLTARYRP